MSKVIVIEAEGDIYTADLDLKGLQEVVGGYIELASNPIEGRASMYVNEEGRILNLPENILATSYYIFDNGWVASPTIYNIRGNAIIIGEIDDEGETLDVDEAKILAQLAELQGR